MDTTERLKQLEELLGASAPSMRRKLKPGATDAELQALAAEVAPLPGDVEAWFRWHNGSGDGFLPDTAWGLITVHEALEELRFARSDRGARELAATTCVPLLTGRDGCLAWYAVEGSEALVWTYERGVRTRSSSFAAWLDAIEAAWRRNQVTLRADAAPWRRSMVGSHTLHVPRRQRAKLCSLLTQLPCIVASTDATVRLEVGATPSWRVDADDTVIIELTQEGALELARALANKKNVAWPLPGLADVNLELS